MAEIKYDSEIVAELIAVCEKSSECISDALDLANSISATYVPSIGNIKEQLNTVKYKQSQYNEWLKDISQKMNNTIKVDEKNATEEVEIKTVTINT